MSACSSDSIVSSRTTTLPAASALDVIAAVVVSASISRICTVPQQYYVRIAVSAVSLCSDKYVATIGYM
eukprot:2236-Heterococcus_DN1.PRE.3